MFDPSDKSFDNLDRVFQPFPPGRHVVFISDAVPFVSKAGSAAVQLEFTVHDPASPARNRVLKFQRLWTSDKALHRLVKLCRSCTPKVGPFDTKDATSVQAQLLDRVLAVEVVHTRDTYLGKETTREEAKDFHTLTAAEAARLVEEYGSSMLPPLDDESTPGANWSDDSDVF
jgi:hypothetical protein